MCRKRAEYNLVLAQYDFAPIRVRILSEGSGCAGIGFKPAAPADTLEDAEIEAILEKADALVAWANDVKEFALSQALSGKVWNSYKLVEGKSNRKYTDEAKVAQAVQNAGYDPYAAPEILGITAMTKLLGKKKFTEILGELLYKPCRVKSRHDIPLMFGRIQSHIRATGKPTLVPASDKRKAWNPTQEDFKEEN